MPILNNQFFTDFLTNVVIIFYFQKKQTKNENNAERVMIQIPNIT